MYESHFLIFGHDSVYCAYWLATANSKIDFDSLGAHRDKLRLATGKDREGAAFTLGGREFMLRPGGSKSGYPYVIESPDFTVEFGPHNKPSFYVHFHSRALWNRGAEGLHQEFVAWADRLDLKPTRPETLSRVDLTFDYLLPVRDFDEDCFVTQLELDRRYRRHGAVETMGFGAGDVLLRVYDKVSEIEHESGKKWFYQIWDHDRDVWRLEWQVRIEALKRFGIRTFADLMERQGDLMTWLAETQTTLRTKTADSNRSRWPLHSLWLDLVEQRIPQLGRQGIVEEIGIEAALETQRARCIVQMNGYMKRLAAIEATLGKRLPLSLPETLTAFEAGLRRVHDRATWEADIVKRMATMRLHPW